MEIELMNRLYNQKIIAETAPELKITWLKKFMKSLII